MNTKQLLKSIELQGKKIRDELLFATKASVAMNKAKSSKAATKARDAISSHLAKLQQAAEAHEDAQYNWGLMLINDLKRKELEAESKKREKQEAANKKAADKQAEKDQIKGLTKADIALAKKHKLLGRSPAGAPALTKFHLKGEIAHIKAEAKAKKNVKKTKGAPIITSDEALAAVSSQMITMAPEVQAKLKSAKVDRKKQPNKASVRKAEKKAEGKSFSRQVAEGIIGTFPPRPGPKSRSKVVKAKKMPASITAAGQKAELLSAIPSSRDTPMGSLQSDGGAY